MTTQLMCRALQRHHKHFTIVASGETTKELLKQAAEHKPDVALIMSSLESDPKGGLKALRQLRASGSTARPIMLIECSEPEEVIEAFCAGAKGVVCLKDPFEKLCKCIQCVHAGQIWANSSQLQWVVDTLGARQPARIVNAKGLPLLTQREEQIVRMVTEGLPSREISSKLGVTMHTVRNHLFRIYEKLGVSNRVELILYALSSPQTPQQATTQMRRAA
jgi:DNA-binding NarL/FixJ family response regulator